MKTLMKNNINHILTTEVYYKDTKNLKKVVDILNKDNFIIISWMIWVWKINFIKFLLNSIWTNSWFFYFNKKFDTNNLIYKKEDLDNLFELYIEQYWNPKIIILEDIIWVNWIKEFINKIHKAKWYKLIIIWNSIKTSWIQEVEIIPKMLNSNISELINYWRLQYTLLNQSNILKRKFLELSKNEIISKDIIYSFWVKNINLLYLTITYLAFLQDSLSLRELHKNLNKRNIKISLITIIDYINNLLSSKMIKQSYTFNIKLNKKITSRIKYYFTDNGIMNSFWNFNIDKKILEENFIYTELLVKWYKIYNWKNWAFDFTFYWIKKYPHPTTGTSPLQEEEDRIYIHISRENDKNELKKEVRKLLKVKWKWGRYLIVTDEQIKEMKIKKFIYDDVKIIKFEELILEI